MDFIAAIVDLIKFYRILLWAVKKPPDFTMHIIHNIYDDTVLFVIVIFKALSLQIVFE